MSPNNKDTNGSLPSRIVPSVASIRPVGGRAYLLHIRLGQGGGRVAAPDDLWTIISVSFSPCLLNLYSSPKLRSEAAFFYEDTGEEEE